MTRSRFLTVLMVCFLAASVVSISPAAGHDNPQPAPVDETAPRVEVDGDEPLSFEEVLLGETGFSLEEWLEPWIATRDEYGFETHSIGWLEKLARRKTGEEGWLSYGVPLTELEQRELDTRERVADQISELNEQAASIPSYAGTHLTINNGRTRVHVRFTERINIEDRNRLRNLISDPSRINFDFTADHNLTELEAASQTLLADPEVSGTPVAHFYIDVARNTVVAAVDPLKLPAARSDQQRQQQDTTALVTVEAQPTYQRTGCFSRTSCGEPLRGGLFAENLDEPNEFSFSRGFAECTTGFMINRGGRRAVTVAEHCGEPGDRFRIGGRVGGAGGTGYPYMPYGETIYNPGGDARVGRYDLAAIEMPLSQYSSHLYRTKRSKFVQLERVHSRNSIIANNTVCVHGPRLGRLCGPVIQGEGVNYPIPGETLTHLDMIAFQIFLPGDPEQWGCFDENPDATRVIAGSSGGPVTNGDGTIAIGSASLCLWTTKEQVRPGVTKIRLAMTPMEPALVALGATLKTG